MKPAAAMFFNRCPFLQRNKCHILLLDLAMIWKILLNQMGNKCCYEHLWRWHKKISPLSVPTATVKLSTISKAMRAMPASRATMTITTNCLYQALEQGMQFELPRDRLRPGWHVPHSTPERLLAHCTSAPFSTFRLIWAFDSGGRQ